MELQARMFDTTGKIKQVTPLDPIASSLRNWKKKNAEWKGLALLC